MQKLTIKQEKFCQKYIELGNASEAYRQSYNAENMKPETIKVKASQMLDKDNIRITISELQGEIRQRHDITIDDIIAELEEARQLALETATPSAAVSATMGKAKLLGLDKVIIEHSGANGTPLQAPVFNIVGVASDKQRDTE